MIQMYEENNTYKLILNSGREIHLTEDEIDDIALNNTTVQIKLNNSLYEQTKLKNRVKDMDSKLKDAANNSLLLKSEIQNLEIENCTIKEELRLLKGSCHERQFGR